MLYYDEYRGNSGGTLKAKIITLFALISLLFLGPQAVQADSHYLLAENDGGDEAYDPFADYSEFDDASEEEADINFFKNGRFLTLAFALGYRSFTENLGQFYDPAVYYGGYLTYFFDLRFAVQVGYTSGDHRLKLSYGGTSITGTTTVSATSFHLKYFMNTQNVTKGLAPINPYLLGGFSQIYRTTKISGYDRFARDSTMSFDLGAGAEIPLMRNKMFLGVQAVYHLASFPDENTQLQYKDDADVTYSTGFFPRGDLYTITALLGINF